MAEDVVLLDRLTSVRPCSLNSLWRLFAPDEFPLTGLVVRVSHNPGGEIDTLELEASLSEVAGSGHRISAQQGLFIDLPAEVKGEVT